MKKDFVKVVGWSRIVADVEAEPRGQHFYVLVEDDKDFVPKKIVA